MSTYKNESVNNRPPQLVDISFFGDVRFDPNDDVPDYIGLNVTCGASTANTDWKVYKFYYASAASSSLAEIRLGYGSWVDRASITGF